jgi:endonuclease/exonuclease/phosphatase family metal-dependent hydrolase
VPLVVISTHLTPYSADQAACEAQLLAARVYRHGGLGLIAGDINHPAFDDEEPDWSKVKPYNRSARCARRTGNEPWRSNRIVGQTLRDAELTDIAAHLADQRGEDSLRAPTGKAGLLRVDQVHVTPALVPAIRDYRRLESPFSDHHGVVCEFDLEAIDQARVFAYT